MDGGELKTLVVRAREGDLEAYAMIVRRFQDMAVGYAYSLLGDFHLAEDVAQEAFVGVYLDLHRLREPVAFLSWFRRIVATRCSRYTRRKRIPTVPLDAVEEIVASQPEPIEAVERQELRDRLLDAIHALPEAERTVMTLFYINEYPQREISSFLNVPVSTVKNCLRSARGRVRERMMDMVRENLEERRPSRNEDFEIRVLDDLARLSDRKMRVFLDEVGARSADLALAMQQADDKVIDRILASMEPWQAELAEFGMLQHRAGTTGMRKAQERILKKANEIAAEAEPVQEADSSEATGPSPAVRAIRSKLQQTAFPAMGLKERAGLFADMASVVQAEGLIALEPVVPDIEQNSGVPAVLDEHLLSTGMRLALDGTWPALVLEIMEARARAVHQQYETRCLVVIDGVLGLQDLQNFMITRLKMDVHYGSDVDEHDDSVRFARLKQRLGVTRFSELRTPDRFADAIHVSLRSRLQETAFSRMGVREICDFFCDAFVLARMRGMGVLKEIVEAVDEDFPRQGLRLLMEGAEPALIRQSLENRMQSLLHQQQIRYRMSITGVEAVQAGEDERVVREKMQGLYET